MDESAILSQRLSDGLGSVMSQLVGGEVKGLEDTKLGGEQVV